MRVFTCIRKSGDITPTASRIKGEGHRVIFKQEGDVLTSPTPDCILGDFETGRVCDGLRKKGYPVVGSSMLGDQLELDSLYGFRIMRLNGIEPLEQELPGVMVEIEAWINKAGVSGILYRFPYTKLCNGDIGPTVNMGYVMKKGFATDRLYRDSLGRVEETLMKNGYTGVIRLRSLVYNGKLYGISFISHFDISGLSEIYIGKVNDLIYGIASGVTSSIFLKDYWAVSLSLLLLTNSKYKGMEIKGINRYNEKHLWLYAVEDGKVTSNGGIIASVTARGDTIREAKRRCYRTINNIKVNDVIYRTDIGNKTSHLYSELITKGWIEEVSHEGFSSTFNTKEHSGVTRVGGNINQPTPRTHYDSGEVGSSIHSES